MTPPMEVKVMNRMKLFVKSETKSRLAMFGNKNSTWDSILIELMDHKESCKGCGVNEE